MCKVRLVRGRLHVHISHGDVVALTDGLKLATRDSEHTGNIFPRENTHLEWWLVAQRGIERVASGKLDGNIEQVMFQDNESNTQRQQLFIE